VVSRIIRCEHKQFLGMCVYLMAEPERDIGLRYEAIARKLRTLRHPRHLRFAPGLC
jgi:hypothetical protein